MILTTEEAAEELGITTTSVRSLVLRGDLQPIVRGARPLRFRLMDVLEAEYRRRTPAQHARFALLASRLETVQR